MSNFSSPLCFKPQRMMTDEDIRKIIDAGIDVLKTVGFTIHGNDEFNSYLSDYGCLINGTHVDFPDAVIKKAMARIEKERLKQEEEDFVPGTEISLFASGQASLYIPPFGSSPRNATQDDLARYHRMLNALNVPSMHPGMIPTDVPEETAELHAFAIIALNSHTPYRVSPFSAGIMKYFLDIMEVIEGSRDAAIKAAPFHHPIYPNSPFFIGPESIEGVLESRRMLGRPAKVTIMPSSGAAAPVTVSGALVQEVAEVLASNIITLALDDNVVGYCSTTSSFDMAALYFCQSGPDSALRVTAGREISKFWFGGPFRHSTGLFTSAPIPGAQSMMEKSTDGLLALLSGVRLFGSAGTLSMADIISPAQLIMDTELRDWFQALLKPFELSDEAMAVDVIKEIAPTGARYLECDHTLDYFRDSLWFPRLLFRNTAKASETGEWDMVSRASKMAEDLLENAENQCPLNDAQRSAILGILKDADRELA